MQAPALVVSLAKPVATWCPTVDAARGSRCQRSLATNSSDFARAWWGKGQGSKPHLHCSRDAAPDINGSRDRVGQDAAHLHSVVSVRDTRRGRSVEEIEHLEHQHENTRAHSHRRKGRSSSETPDKCSLHHLVERKQRAGGKDFSSFYDDDLELTSTTHMIVYTYSALGGSRSNACIPDNRLTACQSKLIITFLGGGDERGF